MLLIEWRSILREEKDSVFLLLYLLPFYELLVCIFKCMYVMAIIPQANHFVSLVAILAHMGDCISELLVFSFLQYVMSDCLSFKKKLKYRNY